MNPGKMHADEVDIDVSLVRRLLAAQFPQWADLPLEPVPSTGTVNAIYRLGDDMAVRLPRVHRWARSLEIEYEWLPKLAPHLALAVPEPLAKGNPGEGIPGIGPSTGGWRARPGPSIASETYAERQQISHSSSLHSG